VPIAAQYIGFSGVMMIARPHVQAELNRVAVFQIVIMAIVAPLFMPLLQERAFILAQALGAALILPLQLWIHTRELKIERRVAARVIVLQALLMGAAALPSLMAAMRADLSNPVLLAFVLGVWCVVIWGAEYALLLSVDNRAELGRMGRALLDITPLRSARRL